MTSQRVRRMALVSLGATILLVAVGGYTRGSGSGYGCADRWPLCEGGSLGGLVPLWDYHMVIEWTHRWLAATVGLLILATAVLAWRELRGRRNVVIPSTTAVGVVGIQAYVGRLIVQNDLDADLVSAHLAISMAVVALLTVTAVNAGPPSRSGRPEPSWSLRLGAGAAVAITVLLLGSYVHNLYVSGWPLVGGEVLPNLDNRYMAVHFAHRLVAGLGLAYLAYLAVTARRLGRPQSEITLVTAAAGCFLVNVGLGAVHVFTKVSSSVVVASHLTLAVATWTLLVAATTAALHTIAADSSRRAHENPPTAKKPALR